MKNKFIRKEIIDLWSKRWALLKKYFREFSLFSRSKEKPNHRSMKWLILIRFFKCLIFVKIFFSYESSITIVKMITDNKLWNRSDSFQPKSRPTRRRRRNFKKTMMVMVRCVTWRELGSLREISSVLLFRTTVSLVTGRVCFEGSF